MSQIAQKQVCIVIPIKHVKSSFVAWGVSELNKWFDAASVKRPANIKIDDVLRLEACEALITIDSNGIPEPFTGEPAYH